MINTIFTYVKIYYENVYIIRDITYLKQAFYFVCLIIPIHIINAWSCRKTWHHHYLKTQYHVTNYVVIFKYLKYLPPLP